MNAAVASTLRATGMSASKVMQSPASYGLPDVTQHPMGDKEAGVVWHTQGSGKLLSMVFYTGKIVLVLNNPTIVVITDRNDLDDQLFDTFAACKQLLRQEPRQVENRQQLKELLRVASGGVIFTTIQKFQPDEGNVYEELSNRRNIVVIADEAHRLLGQNGGRQESQRRSDRQENGVQFCQMPARCAAECHIHRITNMLFIPPASNKSAHELMQNDQLRELTIVLIQCVRQNASIDWIIKESVKAKLKVIVKRTLRQFGYPPDMQLLATEMVLKQAEMIANELATA